MRNSTLASINGAVLLLSILLWIFMPPPRIPEMPVAVPEIHDGTTCALKAGDIRRYRGRSYIVRKVYWSDDLGWIADEDLLTEL